jgi:hypothetical protein
LNSRKNPPPTAANLINQKVGTNGGGLGNKVIAGLMMPNSTAQSYAAIAHAAAAAAQSNQQRHNNFLNNHLTESNNFNSGSSNNLLANNNNNNNNINNNNSNNLKAQSYNNPGFFESASYSIVNKLHYFF